ncbi:MAG: hypothetical protein EA393_07975 [Bacteroidetes bacterium]|nr:MAG: hypothetical protein EA393_07975 [Bacteroidota bacterium]
MKKCIVLLLILISISAFGQKTELRYNLEHGKEYFQEIATESKISQHIMGMDMEVSNKMSMKLGYKVVNKEGRYYDMEVRYLYMSMDMETPYGRNSISSEAVEENDPVARMLSRVINIPFEIRMRDDGKVDQIKNIQEILNKMMEDMADIADPMTIQIGAQLQQQFGESAMISQIENYSRIFPEGPVAKGDQWEKTMGLASMIPMNVNTVYQFMGDRDGFHHIQGLSEISSSDMSEDLSGMNMTMNMGGNQTYSALIDKDTGWISEGTVIQILSGDVFAQNPIDGESINFTMSISTNVTIKGR